MADADAIDQKTAAKRIKGATREISFAFAVDKRVMAADKTLPGERLAQMLKEELGRARIVSGDVVTAGKVVTFDVEKGSLSGVEKALDTWLRRNLGGYEASMAGSGAAKDANEDGEPDNRIFQQMFIRRCLKMAREKPGNFAFGIGGPEGDLLGVHPRKTGKQIGALIKRETGAMRIAFGTVSVDGRLVKFTCEKTPLPGLKKRIIRLFKGWKLMVPVQVFGPEGEQTDDEE
ncbi:MAG: hypothetical protein LDL26_00645 [Caenispirillum bisanense]|nr:hypothetical protein [Caenispirillum bisanense]MCA1972604.1 hypothetical protein [Caenispirillum sp.]